ncbi:HAD domain-containing protein [Actinomadura atramentaria]|uniref:HAD domain-containing protein n=1 Tax=Actinomadura atramentaria TaxID=1990 RepID=UPI00052497EC|nr:HAD domain-containing protein [Actinomadura atramentaria]
MGNALVLVDVDGVLNPRDRPHRGFKRHRCSPNGVTFKLWLNRAHGPLLSDLAAAAGAELAWASYWCDSANEWIAPRVGLPALPFVPIPRFPGPETGRTLGAWKARHVAAYAGARPFVWFEDEPDATECVAAEAGVGPHLLVAVDPVRGLTEAHLALAAAWLAEHGA